jgi:SAM-dependent methyltransferase
MDGMEGSYPSKLRLWASWTTAVVEEPPASSVSHPFAGPHHPPEFADRLYACEALNPLANSPRTGEGAEPYTLQWFLNIENQRHSRQGRWIPHVLEFAKHAGETLLGLGNGLGTDWLQYARHGAAVVVCSPAAEQLTLIRRNFELRGLDGQFLHSTPTALPLGNASIDVACVSGLLHEVADPAGVVQEIYRVLKPGGKVLAVTPAKYDVAFWSGVSFPWHSWLNRKRAREEPAAVRFTGRSLRRLFDRFVEHRVYKRHLRRGDVPHLWRWVPLSLLECLMGRVLVLKTFKPLSAAITFPIAA